MIAIVDYGVGNLFSLSCSLSYLELENTVTSDPGTLREAERIILPGVGAFGDAIAKLRETGLDKVVLREAEAGKPLLGICLGMQLLYQQSCEYGDHKGLGLIPGRILSLREALGEDCTLKVPHMGWNSLSFQGACPLLQATGEGSFVYYVHSYYAEITGDTKAWSEYGNTRVTGVVQRRNVMGTQFHPEKSGDVGLNMLRRFSELAI